MSLIRCSECGNDISDSATSCPKCGARNTGALLKTLLPFRDWVLKGVFVLSILAFFLTNVSLSLPIVGAMKFSMYDMVKTAASSGEKPSTTDNLTQGKPNIKNLINNFASSKDDEKDKSSFGLKLALGCFVVACFGLLLHYILTLVWGLCTFVFRTASKSLDFVWLILAVQFPLLFSMGGVLLISQMKSELGSPELKDNPFAAMGAAMINTISFDPGVIMWILMAIAALGMVFQFMGKKKIVGAIAFEGDPFIRPGRTSLWMKLSPVFGTLALITIILKVLGVFPQLYKENNHWTVKFKDPTETHAPIIPDQPPSEVKSFDTRIRNFDLLNRQIFVSNTCGREFQGQYDQPSFTLNNGEFKTGKEAWEGVYYKLLKDTIYYSDLDGDGSEEVVFQSVCGQSPANYSMSEFEVYRMNGDKPQLAAYISKGTLDQDFQRYYPQYSLWTEMGFKMNGNQIVITSYAEGSHAQPDYKVTMKYVLMAGSGLRLIGKPELEKNPIH